jgi:hypothetical protein
MTSITKRYNAKIKKEALQAMQELIKRIQNGTLKVENVGAWPGAGGTYTFRLIVKDSES